MPAEAGNAARPAMAPRSRLMSWVLGVTGATVLVLALCQRQGTLEKLPEWDAMLERCGRTLVLSSRADLLETASPSAVLEPLSAHPELDALVSGTDPARLADALIAGGFHCVVADPADDGRGGSALLDVRSRLASSHPGQRFAARMIRPDAILLAPAVGPGLDDEVLAFLVGAVRARLAGSSKAPDGAPPGALEERPEGGWDVAVQLQGLAPREVRTARARNIRHDVYAAGKGRTLVAASLAAADELAAQFERRHSQREGPLAGAMERLRIELSVLTGFALVDLASAGPDAGARASFLDRIIDPGVEGLALNWVPMHPTLPLVSPGYRIRLGSDVVYWARPDGSRALERLVTDARLGKIEDLAAKDGLTLDRFDSIHVMETVPGGKVVRMTRGRAQVASGDPPSAGLLHDVAARLATDMTPGGAVRLSYYPVRDVDWLTGTEAMHMDPVQQGFGAVALRTAHLASQDPALGTAAWASLSRLLEDAVFCGHDPDSSLSRPGADGTPVPVAATHRVSSCGPVDEHGRPTTDPSLVGPMVFVVAGDQGAALSASALALWALADAVQAPDPDAWFAPLLEGLVRFVLAMQKDDGTFGSAFVTASHPASGVEDPAAGALALVALAHAAARSGDPRIPGALARGLDAGHGSVVATMDGPGSLASRCSRILGVAPFLALAAAAWVPGDGQAHPVAVAGPELLATKCLLVPADVVKDDLAGGYVDGPWQTPGSVDVLAAAAAASVLALLPPGSALKGLLEEAVFLGHLAVRRLVVLPGRSDHFVPVPQKALYAVGMDLINDRQRPFASFAAVLLLATDR